MGLILKQRSIPQVCSSSYPELHPPLLLGKGPLIGDGGVVTKPTNIEVNRSPLTMTGTNDDIMKMIREQLDVEYGDRERTDKK